MKTPFLSNIFSKFFISRSTFSIWAKTFVAVTIFALPYFFTTKLEVVLSKYFNKVGIPLLIAIFPIFSGVMPKHGDYF